MKDKGVRKSNPNSQADKKATVWAHELPQTVENIKRENQILLTLSNDLTRIRDKNDFILLFKKGIKELFHISHTIITLIDYKDETYTPFLLDNAASPVSTDDGYQEIVQPHYSLDAPFIQSVLQSEKPISFLLEDLIDKPQYPPFLRVNYEKGAVEMLMTKLMKDGKPMGFLHIYTDKPGGFNVEFSNIIHRIAPQISSAASNIIKNEALIKLENEKSFLLDFSSEIAAVRTKEGLTHTISAALQKLSPSGSFSIRRINEDKSTLSPYVHDFTKAHNKKIIPSLEKSNFLINDGLQNRILSSSIPLLLNIDREIQRGITSTYLNDWKQLGIENLVGIRLRNGVTDLGILLLDINEVNVRLLQGICAQISIAMANIMANEQISRTQEEQAFLLNFSKDISRVRTRQDLQNAIFTVLAKTLHTQLAMIRVIEEDGIHLSSFMYDRSLFTNAKDSFDDMAGVRITVDETYTAQVLASEEGIMFSVEDELKSDNAYAVLWKSTGLKNMYALPLRVGDKNIGTIWILANRLSSLIIKGVCAQISIGIANILANEKLLTYKKLLEVENDYLKEQIETIYNFSEIIGSGEQMQKVYRLISLVADSNTSVLITGETGTGKELIARAIHNASPRKDKLMVKVNCAALPASLIESELFGHERGAFTGATDRRIGKFELANHGTLFLDEIGELSLDAQAKVLRVIQERELERIGGKQTISLDVRLLAATNRNLEEEIKAGRFRADLYFRLNVFPIHLPPLRERPADIEPLTKFFIQKYTRSTGRKIKSISPKALHKLRSYSWPGNVRELEHFIERSILLSENGKIEDVFIPDNTGEERHNPADFFNRSLDEVERSYIIKALKRCGGKISGAGGAAEILKIPGNTLHSKMKKLGISKSDYFS